MLRVQAALFGGQPAIEGAPVSRLGGVCRAAALRLRHALPKECICLGLRLKSACRLAALCLRRALPGESIRYEDTETPGLGSSVATNTQWPMMSCLTVQDAGLHNTGLLQ